MSTNIAACIDQFFADRTVQRVIDLSRKTRPLQICFPREVPISRFLAWIFDPTEGHGLHDGVIRSMLTAAWLVREEADLELATQRLLSPAQLSTRSFSGCLIQKEAKIVDGAGQLDVLILHPQSKLLIAVENKFGAGQGDGQLNKYSKALAKRFSDWDRIHIYLDLYGRSPNDPTWIGLNYDWLVDELRVAENSPWLGDEPRRVIRDFRASLEIDGEAYDHLSLDNAELRQIATQHKSVLEVMEQWQRDGYKAPELVDEIFSTGKTLEDKALQKLLPVYWTRADLWRVCIGMLSYAHFLEAVCEKFPDVQSDPYRKAFYFSLPMWQGVAKNGSRRWPLQVMVRVLPPSNGSDQESFIVVSTLHIDEVAPEWEPQIRTLAANLRVKHLKKNRQLGEEQSRISLCVDSVRTEAEATKALVKQMSSIQNELMLLMSGT
jgi:hypothetical protein